ncbi:MAG: nuclear transport factor 2 family protein [Akkermansiaceae bacterium]
MTELTTPRIEAAWKTVETWTEYVHDGDIDSLLLLFCENDNAFWGTFADHMRHTREDLRTYYDKFLDCEYIKCRVTDFVARELTTEIVSFTGIYEFDIQKTKDCKLSTTVARFTFTIRHDNIINRWMFVEHHSSLMPAEGY